MCLVDSILWLICLCFFCNDTSTSEIYMYCHTLSLHYALPIYGSRNAGRALEHPAHEARLGSQPRGNAQLEHPVGMCQPKADVKEHGPDRKSTRLNYSH